jgi:hypothetical protein
VISIIEWGFVARHMQRYRAWKHGRQYVYGQIVNPDGSTRNHARLVQETGRVEFVLWKAGEQGHTDDCWHLMGYGWENWFRPYDSQKQKRAILKAI